MKQVCQSHLPHLTVCYLLLSLAVTVASLLPSTLVAVVGQNVSLPCSFTPHPNMSLKRLVVTWQLLGSDRVVHSFYYQQDQLEYQDPAYRHRTRLVPERLLEGDGSLGLQAVRPVDEAQYVCSISDEFGSDSQTVSVLVAAPYSEPHLTFDLQSCATAGDVQVFVSGGYPKAEVNWTSDSGGDMSEDTSTEFRIDERELYTIRSQIHNPQGNGTNYTFTLRNSVLGQNITRSFAIQGSCYVDVRAQMMRVHTCFGIIITLLLLVVLFLGYLLHRKSQTARNIL